MFITVRYGENKSEIFNPKCRVLLLLKAIRDKCGCEHGDTIDLADETGEVMELSTHPGDYASNYLHARATFILIKVEKECEGGEEDVRYLPLFKGTGLSKSFHARLNRRRSRISDLVDVVTDRRTSHSSRLLSRASSRRLSVPILKSTPKSPNKGASQRAGGATTGVKRDLVTGLKKSS
ncbi:PREDICTED: uncharacterized protein CXorf65 homolog [Branchiostoma belcheri]|uniref:Uncharacterized protein CXorf65 homolog n=1 Tax=Branchiostoma belcheri TaxID=7741 RepID=A0A6P4Y255_BRABE|nr:PREDICTED: uncharacterized protein CXorf65 homolog [Branchiostoma belcheri]